MKIHQISVFMENRPGQLSHPCRALADAGINILTLSLADTQQFGIMRLIVDNWQRGMDVLAGKGYLAKATEVAAIEVANEPGGLARILEIIESCEMNIEYMYAFPCARGDKALLIFRFDDPDRAISALTGKGAQLVREQDLPTR